MARDSSAVPGLKRTRWTRIKAVTAKRFGRLWQPLLFAGLLLGFFMGRALPSSHVAPFGLAFFAAARASGLGRAGGPLVGLAVLAGSATTLQLGHLFWVGVALLAIHLAAVVLKVGRRGATPLGAVVLAAGSAGIPAAMLVRDTEIVQLLFLCCLTGVLALVFTMGIVEITSGKVFHTGASESPVPAIIIVAAALCGLEGVTVWTHISLRDTAAALMIMTFALAGGPLLGAGAGAVLGISLLFTGVGDHTGVTDSVAGVAPIIAPYARSFAFVVAGLLAGSFRELRKPVVGPAFCLGLIPVLLMSTRNPTEVFPLVGSAGVGMILFFLLPRRLLASLPAAFIYTAAAPTGTTETIPLQVIDRIRSLARVLKEVNRTFEQVAVVEAPSEPGFREIIEQASKRVCQSCSMYRECWESSFDQTYQLYTDLWHQMEEAGPLNAQSWPEALDQLCIQPGNVASTLNHLHDSYRFRHHWERRLEEGRALAADYVRNVSRILERTADDLGRPLSDSRLENTPAMRVVSGVARLPKRGSHVSGDSYAGAPLDSKRYLMALSDGMGVGRDAATASKNCVNLLQELLGAGLTTEVAVQTVNSVLLLRSPEETFATVDLSLVDLTTGRAEFVKIGAAPSFIKRGSDVSVVKMASVPVGIINQVQVEPEFRSLRPGDIIVMITDGIWDISKDDLDKERWLMNHLSRETASDPEEIAEGVLAKALDFMPEAGDDMTVLVARVDTLSSARDTVEPRRLAPLEGWAAVKRAPRPKERASEAE